MVTTIGGADRSAMAAVRDILLGKRDRLTTADLAYRIYITILVALIVGFPVAWHLALLVSGRGLTDSATTSVYAHHVPALLAVVTLWVVLLGRVRGAVVPRHPYLDTVVASPISRALALARSMRLSSVIVSAAALLVAGLMVGLVAIERAVDWMGALFFLLAVASAGVQLATAWLAGQLGGVLRRRLLVGICGVLVLLVTLWWIPGGNSVAQWLGPWGWLIGVWDAVTAGVTGSSLIAFALMVGGAGGTLKLQGRMLELLRHEDLAEQSRRWDAVTLLATTYDFRASSGRLKAAPRWGRNWSVEFSSNPIIALAQRDFLAICRFRLRSLGWAVVSVGLGVLYFLAMAGVVSESVAFVLPLLMYFAVGSWAEGLRNHATTIGAVSPFGRSPRTLVLAHLLVPSLLSVVLFGTGAGLAAVLGLGGGQAVGIASAAWLLLLTLFTALLQAFAALKGEVPVELRMPVPTPMGDLSIVSIAMWLADAALIALVVGGWLTVAAVGSFGVGSFGLLCGAIVILAWLSDARLRKLARPAG